jgi:PIN domain-containing protein
VRLREPFTFFVDRSLGGKFVVNALREAGENVIAHSERFAAETDDVVWLSEAASERWVVLTKDTTIRRNELERGALSAGHLASFMLASSNLTGAEMAEAFVRAIPRMKKVLRRFHVPFIASVPRPARSRFCTIGTASSRAASASSSLGSP